MLDDAADEPVEVGPDGPEAGDEREQPTEAVRGVLEITRQRYGFLRLERPRRRPTTTSTSPPPRSAAASCAPATRSRARRASRGAASATARSCTSTRSTARSRRPRMRAGVRRAGAGPARAADARSTAAGDVLVRAVDLLAPLAFGQRVLVRAAPRSGRTTLLRALARAGALRRHGEGDRAADRRAPRGGDRAGARRCRSPSSRSRPPTSPRSSRCASPSWRSSAGAGGWPRSARRRGRSSATRSRGSALAAGDVDEVKRLFGAGRNLAGGGSLTVIATALADGSDEGDAERAVITTESALVTLDPELAAAGVTPAIVTTRVPGLERGAAARRRGAGGRAQAARRARRPRSARGRGAAARADRGDSPRTPSCSASL